MPPCDKAFRWTAYCNISVPVLHGKDAMTTSLADHDINGHHHLSNARHRCPTAFGIEFVVKAATVVSVFLVDA